MAQIKFDRRKGATQDLENLLTPGEIAEILKGEDGGRLPFLLRPLLASGDAPVGYERKSWSESASFYTASRGARSLIATFCGTSKGVGLPIAYFLQMLRDDLYDVVVLYDRRKLHFDRGVEGFSESFLETARRIEAFARAKGYDEIITFGASLGGYPALRAGLLLGARRAISMGGVYGWQVGRLVRNEPTVGAFDLLCPCFADRQVELVAVASAQNRSDVRDLEILRRTFPKCHGVMVDTDQHNVMGYLYSVRLLRLFCACLFEYWESDIRAELLALLNRTARYSREADKVQSDGGLSDPKKQNAQELMAVYASSSWRLTEPLRRTAQALRQLRNWLSGRWDARGKA